MMWKKEDVKNAFYRGVQTSQDRLILKVICEELDIDYINGGEYARS